MKRDEEGRRIVLIIRRNNTSSTTHQMLLYISFMIYFDTYHMLYTLLVTISNIYYEDRSLDVKEKTV